MWFNRAAGISANEAFFALYPSSGGNGALRFGMLSTGDIFIRARQAGTTTDVLSFDSTTTGLDDGAWHHIICSCDLASGLGKIYVDDADNTGTPTLTNTDMDLTHPNNDVGALSSGATNKLEGDLADLWFDTSYIDLSVEANRRDFIDTSSKPVDLGSDGSTPTGGQPIVFLSGDTDDWHTNKGSGGGFTENGALTTASTSPSD